MRVRDFIAGTILIAVFGIGCSESPTKQSHSVKTPPISPDSESTKMQLEAIQKDYDVTVMIGGKHITIGSNGGLMPANTWNQITNALNKALGQDFTNYTINYNID